MADAQGLEVRCVTSAIPCPKCGSPVENREMSLPVQGASQPVRWILASRRCMSGCLLIGEEFLDEH